MRTYHSALLPERSNRVLDRVEEHGSVAFVHDITIGIPPEYARCDAIYTEMSWRPGYETFLKRAGREGASTFRQYLAALATFADGKRPAIMVLGKSLVRYFPTPIEQRTIHFPKELHKGAPCVALVYGMSLPTNVHTTLDVITSMATRFDCVGDPSCGYGNTGRIFAEHGKKFVMSDVNPKCIGWIADHLNHWVRA